MEALNHESEPPLTDRLDNYGCIVERYQSVVWAVAYAGCGDAATSDDVTQETFLAAWKQQADLRDVRKIRGYLVGIARNLALKALRNGGREVLDERLPECSSDEPGPLDAALLREQLAQAHHALAMIPSASLEPFVLFYVEGQSVARVAAELDLSQSVVKQRLYRARESLKEGVAAQLAESLIESRPGKAFGLATMALISGYAMPATAAAVESVRAMSSATETTAAVKTMTTGTGVLGKILVFGAIGVFGLLVSLVATLGASGHDSSPSTQQREPTVASSEQAVSEAAVSSARTATAVPTLELLAPTEKCEGATEQPLVVGRVMHYLADADSDEDGELSETEFTIARDQREEELVDLIASNWQTKEKEVWCVSVGYDGDEVFEGRAAYNIDSFRKAFRSDRKDGLELSRREWIESRLATISREGSLCYELYEKYQDNVRELRSLARGNAIEWNISAVLEDGTWVRVDAPPGLAAELAKVASEDSLRLVADIWGVQISSYHLASMVHTMVERPTPLTWDLVHPEIKQMLEDQS